MHTSSETDSPLLWLGRKLRGLASKRPSVVVQIYGEAGIGKTRAVNQLLQTTPCPSMSKRAVMAIPELIRTLPKPKKISAWLSHQLEQIDDNLQAVPILASYLEQLAPFVLHLEDLHECDKLRAAIWKELSTSLQNTKGLGLLLTSRTKLELTIENFKLEPLNLSASIALLEEEIATTLPQEVGAWIYARAAGNPLFTLEYFRHLARQGFLWNDSTRWQWREPPIDNMPVTVEALIEQLLVESTDSAEANLLLQARAFIETRVPQLTIEPDLLLTLTELSPLALETAELNLQRQGILSLNGFVHPLFREVKFNQLPIRERQTLATRAMKALQKNQPEFAAKVLTDCNFPDDIAFAKLMACAQALVHQPTRAAELKIGAAQYLTGLAKANVMLQALDGLIHSEPKQALSLAEAILETPDLPDETRAKAVYHATFAIATNTRNLAATLDSLSRLPDSQHNDAHYLEALVGYMMMCGQPARALEIWETHPELAVSGEAAILIHVLSGLMQTAQFARAEDLSNQILLRPNLSDREKMNVLNIRAITLAQLGQLEASEDVGLQAIELAKRLELHNALGVMLFNRAVTLERSGQREQMREHATQALVSLEKAGNAGLATQAQLILANNDLESGRYERCEDHLNNAYSRLKHSTITPFLVYVQMALVRFHLQRYAQYARTLALKYARDAVQNAQALGQEKFMAVAQTHLCVALVSESQLEEASNLLTLAMPVLKDLPDTNSFYVLYAQAKLFEARGLPAVETWHRAVSRASELGFLFDANCYQLEIARIESNLQQAKELKNWFETNALWHGANLAKNNFANLEDSWPVPAKAELRLEVLGSIRILHHGVSNAVKGQKRKELLALLLEARISGRNELRTLELHDSLYPNSLEDEGIAALKQIIFKIRAVHGSNIVITTPNGYAMGAIASDVEQFLLSGDTLLWRGTYLDGIQGSAEVLERLSLNCLTQAEKQLGTNPKESSRVLRLLLESDPYNLEILKIACQALRNDNNYRTLQRLFAESKAKLIEVGELLPETWQEFLN